jgi:predicted dithiol-disulfide oxidoreductase (DUF899 family)
MKYADAGARLADYRTQIDDIRRKMRETRAAAEPQEVRDYELASFEGPIRLSTLFGDREDLIVIHNMGASCPYCTLWADGYNGIHHHVTDRAAFALSSPDTPEVQQRFAQSRGWKFRMVSHQGTTFARDMGYQSESGGWLPGISVFRREDSRILRVSDASESPYDDFCALWHLFDLLPGGAGDWSPRFRYP